MFGPTHIKGRGTGVNPGNRFETTYLEQGEYVQPDPEKGEEPSPRTQFFRDSSRTVVTKNDSPDVGFDFSVNPYRGCEHGCVYCYARPTHEYLGLSAGLDFETKIFVKPDAPLLLREKLASPTWRPTVINLSGVTDCYQLIERKLRITRACLEVLGEFKNPFTIITKNHLVTRDVDVLKPMAKISAVGVFISVTTLDTKLAATMEPRTSTPQARLRAIETLAQAGIPVGAMVAPIIPGLTDHEMPSILEAVKAAGAQFAGYVTLRLPYVLDELFIDWLTQHYPERKDKVLSRIKEIRGGELYKADFGTRMRGEGVYAEQIRAMFKLSTQKLGLNQSRLSLSCEHFRKDPKQGEFEL